MPSSNTKQQPHKRDAVNKKVIILSVLGLVLVAALVFFINSYNVFKAIGWHLMPVAKAQDGTLSVTAKDDYDLSSIPDDEIRFRINNNITFEDGYSKGDVMLENPKACKYSIRFSFYLSSTSELIYMSDLLEPGQCITSDKLSVYLKKGKYECAYSAEAYENETLIGTNGGFLTINVKN